MDSSASKVHSTSPERGRGLGSRWEPCEYYFLIFNQNYLLPLTRLQNQICRAGSLRSWHLLAPLRNSQLCLLLLLNNVLECKELFQNIILIYAYGMKKFLGWWPDSIVKCSKDSLFNFYYAAFSIKMEHKPNWYWSEIEHHTWRHETVKLILNAKLSNSL